MFWNDGVVSDIINQENDKMRVIAGKARRIPLVTVKGMETRPTTDRTKETLFNMIAHGLCDCTFLDLFSGSGAIGIDLGAGPDRWHARLSGGLPDLGGVDLGRRCQWPDLWADRSALYR